MDKLMIAMIIVIILMTLVATTCAIVAYVKEQKDISQLSGEVVGKVFKEDWVQLLPLMNRVGNITIITYMPIHHPDSYILQVKRNFDGKVYDVKVGVETWSKYNEGDTWSYKEEEVEVIQLHND
jgi:hypothetical protein